MLGLSDKEDTAELIQRMLWLSVAVANHPKGNRRYHGWIFKLDGAVCEDIHMIGCTTCSDTRRVRVYDECEVCYGEGCTRCSDGVVPSSILCPECS